MNWDIWTTLSRFPNSLDPRLRHSWTARYIMFVIHIWARQTLALAHDPLLYLVTVRTPYVGISVVHDVGTSESTPRTRTSIRLDNVVQTHNPLRLGPKQPPQPITTTNGTFRRAHWCSLISSNRGSHNSPHSPSEFLRKGSTHTKRFRQ